jgi:hypothetical protein
MDSMLVIALAIASLVAGVASIVMLVIPRQRSGAWGATCAFTVIGFTVFTLAGATGGVTSDGVIKEPFFALLPVGYLCLVASVVSGLIAGAKAIDRSRAR